MYNLTESSKSPAGLRKAISSGWGLEKNSERLWGYEYEGNQWQAADGVFDGV